jgi:DNA-directed RNA polymerase subunit RPC12/RpoP
MLRPIREIANSCSTVCPRPGVWMESAGMGRGWAIGKTAHTGFACGRPTNAILPREEISMLIRCRSSNERLLVKPRIEVGIENRVQVGLAVDRGRLCGRDDQGIPARYRRRRRD